MQLSGSEVVQAFRDCAPLPWNIADGGDEIYIVDSNSVVIATMNADPGNEADLAMARKIAVAILCAVNTLGGYKAELPAPPTAEGGTRT